MLVWGGIDNTQVNVYNSGASFSPTTNTWTPLVLTGAPSARGAHATVWTGSEMIVWGGGSSNQQADMVNTGGRYSSQIGTGAVDTEALASNLTLGGTTTGSFSGTLNLVSTTSASAGLVTQSGNPLLHTYGTSNFFAGIGAGNFTLTGINNIAIGASAGSLLSTGGNNIDIGHVGVATDAATIRIGTPGTQTKAFVAGIRGVTTGAANAINVLIDSNGQLGTVSSSRRYKEDIADMGDASARLLSLRPVSFRYKQPFADGGKPLQFGLIAEEVAVAFPELAVFNAEGQPETVKYQDLAPLLLNEVQKLTVEKEELKRQLAERDARDKERDARISRLERLLPSAPAAATKEN